MAVTRYVYCSRCGARNTIESNYCQKCGARLGLPKDDAPHVRDIVEDEDAALIITYLFEWVSAIIIYFVMNKEERFRYHAIQAFILGVLSLILALTPIISGLIALAIWVFGLYVGYRAYKHDEVRIPVISEFAETYSGYEL